MNSGRLAPCRALNRTSAPCISIVRIVKAVVFVSVILGTLLVIAAQGFIIIR